MGPFGHFFFSYYYRMRTIDITVYHILGLIEKAYDLGLFLKN